MKSAIFTTKMALSKRAKTLGIVLIVLVGLLNFHIPHFLVESKTYFNAAAYALELVLLANVLGAVIAAVGIYNNMRWGWLLGIVIAGISVALYLAQETIGLPGLPKMWLEPSRIVSLVVEVVFISLAYYQLNNRSSDRK